MITFLRLLQHFQVSSEFFLLGESDPVDAGQHFSVFIAAPVGPGDPQEFYRLDLAGIRQMRPAAEIGESTGFIKGDLPVFQFINEFKFILVSFFSEITDGFILAHFPAAEGLFFPGELQHAVFDLFKIRIRNLVVTKVDIIIKAVLNIRPDPEFYPGVELLYGFCHQVGTGMPHRGFAFIVIPGQQTQPGIFIDREQGIHDLPIHFG